MPASQQPASIRNMSPSSPAMIGIISSAFGSQPELSAGEEAFSLTSPGSFPEMSSASTGSTGSAHSIVALQGEPEGSDESGESGDDEDLLCAYRDQLAVLSQGKPGKASVPSRPSTYRGAGCAALVNAAASGVDAQWKVVSAATAELKAHWAAAAAQAVSQAAPQQPALVPVESDAHLKAVLAAAVPQLRAHWAAPQVVPKARTVAEDRHLKAVVDRAVTEIKAHWAAVAAPEATPCCRQVLSADNDFAAVVSVLVAEAQAHWAVSEGR